MSLLFERAIAAVDLETATHVRPSAGDLDTVRDEPIPTGGIVTHAGNRELEHPSEPDYRCVPLHERDSAELTGEYVVYTEHTVHGEIFIYRDDDGEKASIRKDDFETTGLAERIRFWHSDYIPDSNPSYYDSPIDAVEPARNPVPPGERDVLFDSFGDFVAAERAAQREANLERATTRSPREIYDDGDGAIPDLACIGHVRDDLYRFRATLEENVDDYDVDSYEWYIRLEFGIFEGNEVLLYPPETTPDPTAAFPIRATVDGFTGRMLVLSPDWEDVDDRRAVETVLEAGGDGFGLSLLLNDVPFSREDEALEAVREDERTRRVLTGEADLTFGDDLAARSTPFDERLNQEQTLAVERALAADSLFCIHGPPGTGKTRTLIEIVRRAVDAGASVLVCADSNQAVDNVVAGSSTFDAPDERSLHAHAARDEFSLARHNARRSNNRLVRATYRNRVTRADVVASTNSSAADIDREFDLVVLDEATQATCPSSFIPISKARKAVLAGDHNQLPPFSASTGPSGTGRDDSLFEHLYADGGIYDGVGVQLRTQYRMHEQISSFPNRVFYDRTLRNGRDLEPLTGDTAIVGYDIGGRERTRDHSTLNSEEARMIVKLVSDLVDEGLSPDEIGVITPYRAQVREIRSQLGSHVDGAGAVSVDTIDSFQGSEQTAILISFTRSNADGRIGFLGRPEDGPRRLNVAITRAKRYCALVGDWTTLRAPLEDGEDESCGDRTHDHEHNRPREKCTELYEDLYSHLEDTGRMRNVEPELFSL